MDLAWKDGFEIKVRIENGATIISANREGLLSLAAQLSALANAENGEHIHYDAYNSLENGTSLLPKASFSRLLGTSRCSVLPSS